MDTNERDRAADALRDPCAGSHVSERGLSPILIVEDSRTSVELLRQLLESLQLANPIVHVDDGDRAVEWLEAAPQRARRPVLILLDVLLPGRDGMEVLRWLRRQEHLSGTPVIILTATADRAHIDEAYGHLGVDSYLVKPVGFDALTDILRTLPLRWALLAAGEHG